MRYVVTVHTERNTGHIVYESDGRLVGFIIADVMSVPLKVIIGEHVAFDAIRVSGWQWNRCCRMPGVGHVER